MKPLGVKEPLLPTTLPKTSTCFPQNPYFYKAFLAGAFGIPLQIISMAGLTPTPLSPVLAGLLLGGSFTVMNYAGFDYFRGFLASLRSLQFDMDTLVTLSCYGAWIYALLSVVVPRFSKEASEVGCFMADSLVTLSVLAMTHGLSERIQKKMADRTQKISTELKSRVPHAVMRTDGESMLLSEVRVMDQLQVAKGHYIPVDGVLLSDSADIQAETLESGEEGVVIKIKGDILYAGTLNVGETVVLQTICSGADSKFNKLLRGLETRDRAHLRINTVLNRSIRYFVPSIVLTALGSFLFWNYKAKQFETAIHSALGILFGACPCALALAVPLTMSIGRYGLLQRNTLVRNEAALFAAPHVDTFVFDKTGTLTTLEVVGIEHPPHYSEAFILKVSASMEQSVLHPVARAIVRYAYKKGIAVDSQSMNVEPIVGGVRVIMDEFTYILGNARALAAAGVPLMDPHEEAVYLARSGVLIGKITLEQTLRPEAKALITGLQKQGLRSFLLSGGSVASVREVAEALGIPFYAEQSLENKEAVVRQQRALGHTLAYVGDGLNDVPAAKASDFSISVDSDVALSPFADVVMTNLLDVLVFLDSSRLILSNMKQNILWSVLYNFCVIVLSSVIFPWSGISVSHSIMGASMAFSSLVVVLNAARLLSMTKETPLISVTVGSLFQDPMIQNYQFTVQNINCAGCVSHLEESLQGLLIQIDPPINRQSILRVTTSVSYDEAFQSIAGKLVGTKFSLMEAAYYPLLTQQP